MDKRETLEKARRIVHKVVDDNYDRLFDEYITKFIEETLFITEKGLRENLDDEEMKFMEEAMKTYMTPEGIKKWLLAAVEGAKKGIMDV